MAPLASSSGLKTGQESSGTRQVAIASRRLNYENEGFRSLINKTLRKLPAEDAGPFRAALLAIDTQWGEIRYWQALQRAARPVTPYYLLAALDLQIEQDGSLARVSEQKALYLEVFARTFWMGLVVTVLCLAFGYPVAYWLATLPTGPSNLLMILVLLPFWTSLLVRTAAWIVLLQSGGIINSGLMQLGLISEPLQLVFNRVGGLHFDDPHSAALHDSPAL